jgi:hypothetical protein
LKWQAASWPDEVIAAIRITLYIASTLPGVTIRSNGHDLPVQDGW